MLKLRVLQIVVGCIVGALTYSAAPSSALAVCGDGILDATEQCDDNNLQSGDSCSNLCFDEAGRTDHSAEPGLNMWAPPYDYSFVAMVDDNPQTVWSVPTNQSLWVNMDFAFTTPNAHRINEYTITNGVNGPLYDPMSWFFVASADGLNWQVLDVQTNVVFAHANQSLTFSVTDTTTAFMYFQIAFDQYAGATQEIAELELVEYTGPVCGDGVVATGEQCDDGNSLPNDGCSACATSAIDPCLLPDGTTPAPDPNPGSALACEIRQCTAAQGWHSVVAPAGTVCRAAASACDVAEQCDGTNGTCPADGMVAAGVSCSDGDLCNGDEQCDGTGLCAAGAALDCNDQDACTVDSCIPATGCSSVVADADADGVPDCTDNCINTANAGQADIDGDGNGDACDAPQCGNGFVEPSEQCDDGAANGTPGLCNNQCSGTAVSTCGDGYVDAGASEQCDDGNTNDNDGCSALCQAEPTVCGDGYLNTSSGEVCDDGNIITEACAYGQTTCTVCDASCQLVAGATAVCGDGTLQSSDGELCDDGNAITEACAYGQTSCTVCDANCQNVAGATSVCGDGNVDAANAEQCDDGNTIDGDGCSSACVSEPPPMTDRTSESGFDIWAPPYDYSFYALVDDDVSTVWSVSPGSFVWMNTNFLGNTPSAFVISEFTITSASGPRANDPREVHIWASADGVNWVALHSQYGISFTGPNQKLTFPIANATAHTFFSFDFHNNGGTSLEIAEMELNEATGGGGGGGPICGDGTCDPGENNANCSLDCAPAPVCGNWTVETGESCDDGNTTTEACAYGQTSCTVCDATCQNVQGATSYCGDTVCDAAAEDATSCASDCAPPASCGDGVLSVGEVCDSGAQNGQVGFCNTTCSLAVPEPGQPTYSAGACPTIVAGLNTGFAVNGTSASFPIRSGASASSRSFEVRLPASPDGAAVMLAWHRYGGTAAAMVDGSPVDRIGLDLLPANQNVIVVAPMPVAAPPVNDMGYFEWFTSGDPVGNPDLLLAEDVLACLHAQYGVDLDRIYSVGQSAGAMWNSYLAQHWSHRLAAAVTFSGGETYLPGYLPPADRGRPTYTTPQTKIPVLLAWGGSTDMYYSPFQTAFDFENATALLGSDLRNDGHLVVECRGTYGHDIPAPIGAAATMPAEYLLWPFFSDHPRSVATGSLPEPYATGLPNDAGYQAFNGWCSIP